MYYHALEEELRPSTIDTTYQIVQILGKKAVTTVTMELLWTEIVDSLQQSNSIILDIFLKNKFQNRFLHSLKWQINF